MFTVLRQRVDKYCLDSDSWHPMPPLLVKRNFASPCILGNCLYVYGLPKDKNFQHEGTIERLVDPGNDKQATDQAWGLIKLPVHMWCVGGIFAPLNSHELMICGGWTKESSGGTRSRTIVNTRTFECKSSSLYDSWRTAGTQSGTLISDNKIVTVVTNDDQDILLISQSKDGYYTHEIETMFKMPKSFWDDYY